MSETTPAQLPDPVRGGSYLRHPETGELHQVEGPGEPAAEQLGEAGSDAADHQPDQE